MNAGLSETHPSIHYYDSDYPWAEGAVIPGNFDEITKFQGVALDVARYKQIAEETGGPILELCCGTGRVAIPMARAGHDVTGVDISQAALGQFESNLRRETPEVRERVTLERQDITSLSFKRQDFKLAIIAFNSLLCIPDFHSQLKALAAVRRHLPTGGIFIIDIVNPIRLNIQGDPSPKPFFTRKNVHNGNTYTRFAAMGPFDENHKQELFGWYDELDAEGRVRRTPYSMHWRPIFRFEIELMLKEAGFKIKNLAGGHSEEQYTVQSPRMFIMAEGVDHS